MYVRMRLALPHCRHIFKSHTTEKKQVFRFEICAYIMGNFFISLKMNKSELTKKIAEEDEEKEEAIEKMKNTSDNNE